MYFHKCKFSVAKANESKGISSCVVLEEIDSGHFFALTLQSSLLESCRNSLSNHSSTDEWQKNCYHCRLMRVFICVSKCLPCLFLPLIKGAEFSLSLHTRHRGHCYSLCPEPEHWDCVKAASIMARLHAVSTKKCHSAHSACWPICNFQARGSWHVFIAKDHL